MMNSKGKIMTAEEYQRIKEEVETLQRQLDQTEGALIETMQALKERHDCDTLEEAQALLETIERKIAKLEAKRKRLQEKFREDWGEFLK